MMPASIRAIFFAFAALATAALVDDARGQTPPKPPSSPPAQRTAQANQGPPNALQGFSQNRDKPVQIEAASLEVRDKDKVATFSGNVHVIQGDTDLRSKTLVVFYEGDDADAGKGGIKAAQPGPGGSSQIKRLEASGNVLVSQKDQTATGDKGVFDMKTNTITLMGNVVVSQGQNVLRGERLVVDRVTGVSRMEGGRVQGIFQRGPKEEGSSGIKLPGTN
jgi:lipopolysaccharide export system protein LptA